MSNSRVESRIDEEDDFINSSIGTGGIVQVNESMSVRQMTSDYNNSSILAGKIQPMGQEYQYKQPKIVPDPNEVAR
jgi:hypothetical protein